ncbi:MAG TPA: transcription antitermination factor NusB [Geobacteraceae bacterium]
MGLRREGRELALQALYAVDINPLSSRQALALFWETTRTSAAVRHFAEELVEGVLEHRQAIDAKVTEKSKNWALARMAKVDVNILRLAVFELLFRADIPKVVTINEAIEVAKKFGNEDSPAFVNGILDEVATEIPEK